MSECVSAASASACSPWTSNVFINTTAVSAAYGQPIASADQWNSQVLSASSATGLSAKLGCSASNSVQYYLSYLCMRDILLFSAGCSTANKAPVPSPSLDVASCTSFSKELSAYLSDSTQCPALDPSQTSQAAARTNAANAEAHCSQIAAMWAQVYPSIPSTPGVDADYGSCGYASDSALAKSYCSSNANAACCKLQGQKNSISGSSSSSSTGTNSAGAPVANASDTNASSPVTPVASTSSGLGPVAIGGIVVGAAVLLLAVAGLVIARRRHQSHNKNGISDISDSEYARGGIPIMNNKGAGGAAAYTRVANGDESLLAAGSVASTSPVTVGAVSSPAAVSHPVKLAYTACNADELTLEVGDLVEVLESFDDGWAKGAMVKTGQAGMFPLVCIKGDK